MESISESSQQQKRKPVTHGLEDQKRVSGGTSFIVCCLELELLCGAKLGGQESGVHGPDLSVFLCLEEVWLLLTSVS